MAVLCYYVYLSFFIHSVMGAKLGNTISND